MDQDPGLVIVIMVPAFLNCLVISLGYFGPAFRPSCRHRHGHAGSGGLRACDDPIILGYSIPTQPTYPPLPS